MSHGFDTARLDRIPAFLEAKYVGTGRLPHAATLVSRRGEIAHLSCIGEARPGAALTEDAIFRIASMTKPITSIAFMMLVEEGKVALSDPLVKFCPEFKDTGVFVAGGGNVPFLTRPPAQPIRMVDLLRHTSGLTYGFQERTPVDAAYRKARIDDFDADYTMDSFIADLAKIPLQFDPGAHWNYSMATDVLGAVIERIEDKPFAEVLQERIFEPLGMTDTAFVVPPEKHDRLAAAYQFRNDSGLQLIEASATSPHTNPEHHPNGGLGLLSTTADYWRFAQMLLNRGTLDDTRILSPKTIDLITANHISSALFPLWFGSYFPLRGTGFGLGGSVLMDPAQAGTLNSPGTYGWGGSLGTSFQIDPQEEMIGITMQQLDLFSPVTINPVFKTLAYAAIEE